MSENVAPQLPELRLASEDVTEQIALTREQQVEALADQYEMQERARELARERRNTKLFRAPEVESIEVIAELSDEEIYRADGLILSESDTLIIGQRKAGKTTFMFNLMESLVNGTPFLGKFETRPVTGKICFLNYELSKPLFAKWAREMELSGPDSPILHIDARGNSNPLATDHGRSWLIKMLKEQNVEVLIVDVFGVAFAGSGEENSSTDVRKWLEKLSDLRINAGVKELILTAHAGKDADKGARGSSALEDWAASFITVGATAMGQRWIRALGRDVLIERTELVYDSETRRLSLKEQGTNGVDKPGGKIEELMVRIVSIVAERNDVMTSKDIEEALNAESIPYTKADVKPARELAVAKKLLTGGLGIHRTSVAPAGWATSGKADMSLGG